MALPLIGIAVIKAARSLGLVGSDALYQFILMLQFALPPAMSVGNATIYIARATSDSFRGTVEKSSEELTKNNLFEVLIIL